MNFGDILSEWDDIKKSKAKEEKAHPSSPRAGAVPGKKTSSPGQSGKEGMIAWMNRYGVPDKDGKDEEVVDERAEAAATRRRLDSLRPEATIDLHGFLAEEALDRLRLFLDDSVRRGLSKVLIIHGKGNHSEGDPVLSGAVSRFLEGYPQAGRRKSADKADGGKGATVLFLKYPGKEAE